MRVSSERAEASYVSRSSTVHPRLVCICRFPASQKVRRAASTCFSPYSPSSPSRALPFEAIPLLLAHTRQRVVRSWGRQSTVSAHQALSLPRLKRVFSFWHFHWRAFLPLAHGLLKPWSLRCTAWFWCHLHRLDVADNLPRFMLTTRSQLPHLCHGLKFKRGTPTRHCCTYKFFHFGSFTPSVLAEGRSRGIRARPLSFRPPPTCLIQTSPTRHATLVSTPPHKHHPLFPHETAYSGVRFVTQSQ